MAGLQVKTAKSRFASPMAVVEIIADAGKFGELPDTANGAVRAIAASEAFRKYDFLFDTPGTNAIGNFRGMVIDAKWRTVYNLTSQLEDVLGPVLVLAGFAQNLLGARPKIDAIFAGNDPGEV